MSANKLNLVDLVVITSFWNLIDYSTYLIFVSHMVLLSVKCILFISLHRNIHTCTHNTHRERDRDIYLIMEVSSKVLITFYSRARKICNLIWKLSGLITYFIHTIIWVEVFLFLVLIYLLWCFSWLKFFICFLGQMIVKLTCSYLIP